MTPKTFFQKACARVKDEAEYAWLDYKTRHDYNRRPATGKMRPRPEGDFCDLAVVTFNNAEVVDYQIRTLERFFTFPYRYTVFDNSTDEAKASEIADVCRRHDTAYIRLPRQEFLPKGRGSYSHGIACNYLFSKYIQLGGVNSLAS